MIITLIQIQILKISMKKNIIIIIIIITPINIHIPTMIILIRKIFFFQNKNILMVILIMNLQIIIKIIPLSKKIISIENIR